MSRYKWSVVSYMVIGHITFFFVHFRQLLSPVGLFSLLRYAATYFRLFKDYFCVIKLPKVGNKLQKTEIHSYFLILAFFDSSEIIITFNLLLRRHFCGTLSLVHR